MLTKLREEAHNQHPAFWRKFAEMNHLGRQLRGDRGNRQDHRVNGRKTLSAHFFNTTVQRIKPILEILTLGEETANRHVAAGRQRRVLEAIPDLHDGVEKEVKLATDLRKIFHDSAARSGNGVQAVIRGTLRDGKLADAGDSAGV